MPCLTKGDDGGMTFGDSGCASSEEAASDNPDAPDEGGACASNRLRDGVPRDGVPRCREGPGDRVEAARTQ